MVAGGSRDPESVGAQVTADRLGDAGGGRPLVRVYLCAEAVSNPGAQGMSGMASQITDRSCVWFGAVV